MAMSGERVVVIPFPRVGTARPASLRLTRRGRVVVRLGGLLLVALALVATLLIVSGRADATTRVERPSSTTRVVLPGETLWGIATQVAPHRDPRETIRQIVELNSLGTAAIRAGQRLWMPAAT